MGSKSARGLSAHLRYKLLLHILRQFAPFGLEETAALIVRSHKGYVKSRLRGGV